MRSLSVKRNVSVKVLIIALVAALFVLLMPFRVFAAGGDGEGSKENEVVVTESSETETASETAGDTETSEPEETSETVGGNSSMSEEELMQFAEVPKPVLDNGVAKFFDTVGGKILGFLLKLLSVGMVISVVLDLVFVAVPFTRGIALSLERSGIHLISNEAHIAAGVPKETPQGNQHGRGGMAGGYGGGMGGYGAGGMGGYGAGGMGYGGGAMNSQQAQQQNDMGGGVKTYIKSSIWRLILVTAFAVFMLSGAYIHVGYALGNGLAQAFSKV